MKPAEHYQKAEALIEFLEELEKGVNEGDGVAPHMVESYLELQKVTLQAAQVHATLALYTPSVGYAKMGP
jgi:hypothetical protein